MLQEGCMDMIYRVIKIVLVLRRQYEIQDQRTKRL